MVYVVVDKTPKATYNRCNSMKDDLYVAGLNSYTLLDKPFFKSFEYSKDMVFGMMILYKMFMFVRP